MRRRTRVVLIALTAMLLAGVMTVPSGASVVNEVVDLVGPAVTKYDLAPYVFENSSRIIRVGARTPDGGCAFSGEKRLQSGESITEIEIAYDPLTCRSLVETGKLISGDESLAAAANSEDAVSQSFTTAPAGQESEPGGGGSVLPTQEAFMWSWYDEPARWVFDCDVEETPNGVRCLLPPVNFVRNGIEWTPDGVCARSPGTTAESTSRIFAYQGTFWSAALNQFTRSPNPLPCGQDVFSQNVNRFENRFFCNTLRSIGLPLTQFGTTRTFYEPNRVEGDENGTAFFRWNLRKSGPCSALLRAGAKFDNQAQSG